MIRLGTYVGRLAERELEIDETKHAFLIGATGTGKSTVLKKLMYPTFKASGALIIDPGPLCDEALSLIPKERTNDVILIDPLAEKVPGLNIFSGTNKDAALGNFTKIVGSTWKDSWGPRSDYITRNAGQALIATEPELTVIHFAKFFMSQAYREELRAKANGDPYILSFFQKFEDDWNERSREDWSAAPHNKMDMFLQPLIRPIVGQYHGLDIKQCMDEGKILILRLSKADLGPDMPAFLGSVMLYLVLQAALRRKPGARHFSIFIDEFHNFYRGDAVEHILSELRKFGISITMADQTIEQLPPGSEAGIFGNVWTIMCARVGVRDSEIMAKALGWGNPQTLQNLSLGEWVVRTTLSMNGTLSPSDPLFSYIKPMPRPEDCQDSKVVIEQALRRHGKARTKVETEIRAMLS